MTKRPHTINSFALCKIVIVCIGEKTVSISSYYSLDVSATIRFQTSEESIEECSPYPPSTLKKSPSMAVDGSKQDESW